MALIGTGYAAFIQQMSKLLHDDPVLFEAYAVRDAEVSAAWLIKYLHFLEAELGIEPGRQPPATLGAAAVKKFRAICKDDDYDLDELLGLEWTETIDKGRRRKVKDKIPDFRDHEGFFADCYHGGRNEAYFAGFTPEDVITDIDIRGAYTTAMATIHTPDWRGAIDTTDIAILAEPGDRGMGFARVRFRFPNGTRFPCLPVRAGDAGLIYPLSGTSYATGPELVVARRLGVNIEVEHGVFVPWLDDRRPFLQFTEVINTIRKAHETGSALELAAKEIGNSCYGKVAQGTDLLKSPEVTGKSRVSGKRVFDSRKGEMTTLPPSSISNPALAAFITGLARAFLLAKTFQLIIRSNWANDGQVKLTEIWLFTYFPGRSGLSVTRALTTTRPSRRDQVRLSSTCRSISPGFVRSSPNSGLIGGAWHLPLKADIGCLLNSRKRT